MCVLVLSVLYYVFIDSKLILALIIIFSVLLAIILLSYLYSNTHYINYINKYINYTTFIAMMISIILASIEVSYNNEQSFGVILLSLIIVLSWLSNVSKFFSIIM